MKIAASILNCNFLYLAEEIKKAEAAGIDCFHLDVMDGHFVPNLSFGIPILKCLKKIATKPIITHLMVKEPEKMIKNFLPDSEGIIFHLEATKKVRHCINLVHKEKKCCGIALNPKTSYKKVLPYLEEIEDILVMSVHPGFGGQKFLPEVIPKIKKLKAIIQKVNRPLIISVDGGVNYENTPLLRAVGVDMIIVGTFLFSSSDYKKTIAGLKCLI